MKTSRNPSIELYRIVLMFLIVLGHASLHGNWRCERWTDGDPLQFFLFTMLFIWHVDGFLVITGWFGTRFSLAKFAKLWGVILFYSALSVAFGWFSYGHHVGRYMAGGWFGCSYLCFLFLTPLINAAVTNLTTGDRRTLYLAWALFDFTVICCWIPQLYGITRVMTRCFEPYSIATFIVIYVNTRFFRLSGLAELIKRKHILWVIVIFVACAYLSKFEIVGADYLSPPVMLMGMVMLILFLKFVHIPQQLGPMILSFAPLTFGIYILHETTCFGRLFYLLPQRYLCQMFGTPTFGLRVLYIIVSAVVCFVSCALVEMIRRKCVASLDRFVMPYLVSLDHRCGLI